MWDPYSFIIAPSASYALLWKPLLILSSSFRRMRNVWICTVILMNYMENWWVQFWTAYHRTYGLKCKSWKFKLTEAICTIWCQDMRSRMRTINECLESERGPQSSVCLLIHCWRIKEGMIGGDMSGTNRMYACTTHDAWEKSAEGTLKVTNWQTSEGLGRSTLRCQSVISGKRTTDRWK